MSDKYKDSVRKEIDRLIEKWELADQELQNLERSIKKDVAQLSKTEFKDHFYDTYIENSNFTYTNQCNDTISKNLELAKGLTDYDNTLIPYLSFLKEMMENMKSELTEKDSSLNDYIQNHFSQNEIYNKLLEETEIYLSTRRKNYSIYQKDLFGIIDSVERVKQFDEKNYQKKQVKSVIGLADEEPKTEFREIRLEQLPEEEIKPVRKKKNLEIKSQEPEEKKVIEVNTSLKEEKKPELEDLKRVKKIFSLEELEETETKKKSL